MGIQKGMNAGCWGGHQSWILTMDSGRENENGVGRGKMNSPDWIHGSLSSQLSLAAKMCVSDLDLSGPFHHLPTCLTPALLPSLSYTPLHRQLCKLSPPPTSPSRLLCHPILTPSTSLCLRNPIFFMVMASGKEGIPHFPESSLEFCTVPDVSQTALTAHHAEFLDAI